MPFSSADGAISCDGAGFSNPQPNPQLADCADHPLAVDALPLRASLRPSELPDVGTAFTITFDRLPCCILASGIAVATHEDSYLWSSK
jgi:hypothetical protein